MNSIDKRLEAYNWSFLDINPKTSPKIDSNNNSNTEEKLKVDRKKFETLLEGNDPKMGSANTFFDNIMSEFPSVVITWPPMLRSGTKSKKDPHVKISGPPLMVKAVRAKILDLLDPKVDRVTLKMDVDWSAHSHIIGKSGSCIQQVMDSTGCHVHFPDANRTNAIEKSNQVSIAGTVIGISQARQAIRNLLPVLISFSFVLKSGFRSTFLDRLNRVVQLVEQLTSTQVVLRFTANNYRSDSSVIVITIKGIFKKCELLKVGIDLLFKFMDEFVIKKDIKFEITTEISGQHHNFVMGVNKCNVKSIMQTTGAIISFPEYKNKSVEEIFTRLSISSPIGSEVSEPRKTTINVKGNTVEGVLMAFQLLELHLPLSLTFDLKEGQEVKASYIEELSREWNVSISVKPKPKQNTKTIWIKGAEKDEWKLFEVRRALIEDNQMVTKPLANIWGPIDLDFAKNLLVGSEEIDETFSIGSINEVFNKAPGAERNRVFCTDLWQNSS